MTLSVLKTTFGMKVYGPSDDQSLNPTEVYSFYLNVLFENNKSKPQKRLGSAY